MKFMHNILMLIEMFFNLCLIHNFSLFFNVQPVHPTPMSAWTMAAFIESATRSIHLNAPKATFSHPRPLFDVYVETGHPA